MQNFIKNYLSTLLFIFVAYFIYSEITFYQNFLIKNYSLKFIDVSINTLTIFKAIILSYVVLLIPFYIFHKDKSKARIIIKYLGDKIINYKQKITKEEKVSILAWAVKLFFAPLMIVWLTWHIFTMLNNIYFSYNDISLLTNDFFLFFNKHFFWLFFTIILFFDVLFFTLWYLIESPKLNNKIRSVDPTLLWWFVVLICYPPFNAYTTEIIWWYSKDFPTFINEYVHIILNMTLLILMWIYSWASISLWLKASNLTNRWIVNKWPYKYIRHPAYICKNTAWWIWWMPLLIWNLYTGQYKHFFIVLFWLAAWTFIYYMRAMTEERHLSMDKDYLEYKKEVKYKFIPKIY